MGELSKLIPGTFKNGVVVPEALTGLNDGDKVVIIRPDLLELVELARELDGWQRASDEVWAMIDELERMNALDVDCFHTVECRTRSEF